MGRTIIEILDMQDVADEFDCGCSDPLPGISIDEHRVIMLSCFNCGQIAGWTPLGHFELQRRRDRLPLSELLP